MNSEHLFHEELWIYWTQTGQRVFLYHNDWEQFDSSAKSVNSKGNDDVMWCDQHWNSSLYKICKKNNNKNWLNSCSKNRSSWVIVVDTRHRCWPTRHLVAQCNNTMSYILSLSINLKTSWKPENQRLEICPFHIRYASRDRHIRMTGNPSREFQNNVLFSGWWVLNSCQRVVEL